MRNLLRSLFGPALGVAGLALLSKAAIPDAQTVADRWATQAGAAGQRYAEGVARTDKDPTQLAAAQAQKMLTNVTQAITSGLWQRRLADVGKQGWQAAVAAKGAANYATGVAASKQRFQQAMVPLLAYEASLQQRVNSMPKGSLPDSIARATEWITGMAAYRQNR